MEQLTDNEINLMVESLLFSSCLEITDKWLDSDRYTMMCIANKIKNLKTSLKNINLHVFNKNTSNISQEILALFPTIKKIQYLDSNISE